jgi:hypothetical protein
MAASSRKGARELKGLPTLANSPDCVRKRVAQAQERRIESNLVGAAMRRKLGYTCARSEHFAKAPGHLAQLRLRFMGGCAVLAPRS